MVNNVDTDFTFVNAELHNISIPYSIVSIKVFSPRYLFTICTIGLRSNCWEHLE